MVAQGEIAEKVATYYRLTLSAHGATHRGVDWPSRESQRLRFVQLLKIRNTEGDYSINDVGCGYGALAHFLADERAMCRYYGYDLCDEMIEEARRSTFQDPRFQFSANPSKLLRADYTVASGIFNVRFDISDDEWRAYMEATVSRMFELSAKGLAFNVLTRSPDTGQGRPDLYFADPHFWFDYCRGLSKRVALLHDYPLHEFTLFVRRDSSLDGS